MLSIRGPHGRWRTSAGGGIANQPCRLPNAVRPPTHPHSRHTANLDVWCIFGEVPSKYLFMASRCGTEELITYDFNTSSGVVSRELTIGWADGFRSVAEYTSGGFRCVHRAAQHSTDKAHDVDVEHIILLFWDAYLRCGSVFVSLLVFVQIIAPELITDVDI